MTWIIIILLIVIIVDIERAMKNQKHIVGNQEEIINKQTILAEKINELDEEE